MTIENPFEGPSLDTLGFQLKTRGQIKKLLDEGQSWSVIATDVGWEGDVEGLEEFYAGPSNPRERSPSPELLVHAGTTDGPKSKVQREYAAALAKFHAQTGIKDTAVYLAELRFIASTVIRGEGPWRAEGNQIWCGKVVVLAADPHVCDYLTALHNSAPDLFAVAVAAER